MKKYAIILAAGKGTRMNSELPKCTINFCGKTIIERIVEACQENNFDEIIVVVGYKSHIVENILKDKVKYIYQQEQLGTANAVLCCQEYFKNKEGTCVIIPGDMPLIDSRLIYKLLIIHSLRNYDFTFVSSFIEKENQYGKVYRIEGYIKKIIEYKDATDEQKKIEEVNSGIYCVDMKKLFYELINISNNNNNANEYYLTDLIEIFAMKYKIGCYIVNDYKKVLGVNTVEELNDAINIYINEQY